MIGARQDSSLAHHRLNGRPIFGEQVTSSERRLVGLRGRWAIASEAPDQSCLTNDRF